MLSITHHTRDRPFTGPRTTHGPDPRGQPSLPDNPVTAYVINMRATSAAPGFVTTRRTQTTRLCDPTRECNACVASASSSYDSRRRHVSSPPTPNDGHDSTSSQKPGTCSTKS
jgi:hypothetical protein